MRRLLLLTALLGASPALAQTQVYAEGAGAAGSYAVGVEQGVLASANGERRLAVRAGVSYWNEPSLVATSATHLLAIPAGAVASFSLGQPLGIPLATEVGGGVVFTRRTGERYAQTTGEAFGLPPYGEVALRATLGRASVRGGLLVGGVDTSEFSGSVRPVAGVGLAL